MRRLCLVLALLFAVCLVRTANALAPGDAAPVFTVPLLEGGNFEMGAYVGKKVIVLDWWSINCTSCVQEIPKLIDIYNRYSKDAIVVGMNVDSFILKRVSRFLETQSFKIPYPIVVDAQLRVMKQYGSSVLPTTVVIDKKGRVALFHVGYKPGDEAEIEEKLKKAIAGK